MPRGRRKGLPKAARPQQIEQIERCILERDISGNKAAQLLRDHINKSPGQWATNMSLSATSASAFLNILFELDYLPSEHRITGDGGFYLLNDKVYNVRRSAGGNLYAMVMVIDPATKSGAWCYARGAMQSLRTDMEIGVEQAAELGARYHVCVICGTELTNAKSIERGLGPLCSKKLRRQAELDAERHAEAERQHAIDRQDEQHTAAAEN